MVLIRRLLRVCGVHRTETIVRDVEVGRRCNGCGVDTLALDAHWTKGTVAGPNGAIPFDLCPTCTASFAELCAAHAPSSTPQIVDMERETVAGDCRCGVFPVPGIGDVKLGSDDDDEGPKAA